MHPGREAGEHCEGMHVGDQRIIDSLHAFLPDYLRELENPDSN
ncbi:hypothetical protein ACFFQF_12435 [Haladaptatus pallidirubidus]|nr:hypothetical protein [Haladaptatus pallidirubidus]